MSRPLRIEFPGALYHVTSRGDRREDIFVDDMDRACLLAVVAQGLARLDGCMLAYCLMSNHYHFVLQTRQGNLSALMRHINGNYTQAFNRRHGKVGHLFQGRFKAILVDEDNYLLEVCRYVELNPVRAAMVAGPSDWPWSSYRAHVGQTEVPQWLANMTLWGYLLGHDPQTISDCTRAQQAYAALVAAGRGATLWEDGLNQQIYLGDDAFVGRMLERAQTSAKRSPSIPKAQRTPKRSVAQWMAQCATREEAFRRAYTEGGWSMSAIAKEVGLSLGRVSQLIAKAEQEDKEAQGSGWA